MIGVDFGKDDVFKVTGSGPGPCPLLESVTAASQSTSSRLLVFQSACDLETDQLFGIFCALGIPSEAGVSQLPDSRWPGKGAGGDCAQYRARGQSALSQKKTKDANILTGLF